MSGQQDKPKSSKINLGSKKLKSFFTNHLNRIYFAKAHLVSKLPLLKDEVSFSDLRHAIQETVEDVEKQMARMELIYELLDTPVFRPEFDPDAAPYYQFL